MTDTTPTLEQIHKAQEQQARMEALLLRVVQGATLAERQAAAREAGILSPANVQLQQTRVVLRMVRTDDGKFWIAIEGAHGTLSQVILGAVEPTVSVLAGVAALVVSPLCSDAEHKIVTQVIG
jgi:hypothetical protein